jgi:hypothetical protein
MRLYSSMIRYRSLFFRGKFVGGIRSWVNTGSVKSVQEANRFREVTVERFFSLSEGWLAGVFRRLLLLEVIKWRIGFCNLFSFE